jgi:hypothetical protein
MGSAATQKVSKQCRKRWTDGTPPPVIALAEVAETRSENDSASNRSELADTVHHVHDVHGAHVAGMLRGAAVTRRHSLKIQGKISQHTRHMPSGNAVISL